MNTTISEIEAKLATAKAVLLVEEIDCDNTIKYHISQMRMRLSNLENFKNVLNYGVGALGDLSWELEKMKDKIERLEYAQHKVKSLTDDLETEIDELNWIQAKVN